MAQIIQNNGTTVIAIGSPPNLPVIVDFGFPSGGEGDTATTTVSSPTVTATSNIVCTPVSTASTPDHDPDDVPAEGILAYASNIVPGVSFDVIATAPQNTWGRYLIIAIQS